MIRQGRPGAGMLEGPTPRLLGQTMGRKDACLRRMQGEAPHQGSYFIDHIGKLHFKHRTKRGSRRLAISLPRPEVPVIQR